MVLLTYTWHDHTGRVFVATLDRALELALAALLMYGGRGYPLVSVTLEMVDEGK